MQDQLMVSVSPVVSYARVLVDYQGLHAKLLESRGDAESTMTSALRNRNDQLM